jgi:hypothetical protein
MKPYPSIQAENSRFVGSLDGWRSSVFIWGAQFETGTLASLPIPTSGGTVAVDLVNGAMTWPIGLVNDFVIKAHISPRENSGDYWLVLFGDNSNRVQVNAPGVNENVTVAVLKTGETIGQAPSPVGQYTHFQEIEVLVLKSSINGLRLFVEGTQVADDSSTTYDIASPTDGNLRIAYFSATYFSRFRNIEIYSVPAAITDVEVLAL